jgi:aspartate racemase
MNNACEGRRLGLIGGLGVGSTVHYYRELAKAYETLGRTLDLLVVHADMQRVFGHFHAGTRDGLAEYLAGLIGRLKDGGAEVAAISAVTPHLCIKELAPICPLPLISLLDPVREEVVARGIGRVAIFGTRFTIETGMFGSLGDVEVVMPRPAEVDAIHGSYFKLASDGAGSEELHAQLTALAHTLCEREGVEAIVFAGTDLALIFNDANADFPYIDCSRVHVQEIVRALTQA